MDTSGLSQLFFDDNYTLESILTKAKESQLNLTQLRDSLIQQQQDLNQKSLELFNNNYDQFYKLSYLISCLNEPIQHLQEPLETFKKELSELCENHDSYIDKINLKLSSIEETCKNKDLALKLISTIKTRDRLEKQIKNVDWSIGPNSKKARNYKDSNYNYFDPTSLLSTNSDNYNIEYKIKCDLIERLSIELHYLSCDVEATKPTNDELISIKKSLQTSIDERQKQFDSWSERTFLAAIEATNKELIELILRIHRQSNSTSKIDLIWQNKVVRPYLNLTITDDQFNQDDISNIFELLHQFIEKQWELIGAQFVIKSFWNEIIMGLVKLEKVYSLNNLESFQKKYIQMKNFLNKQNEYLKKNDDLINSKGKFCLTKEEIDSNIEKIFEKFNLKIYFNHRSTQITTSVENSLNQQPLSEIPANIILDNNNPELNSILSKFKLKICMHIYVLITKCWSQEIYIDALELNFMDLSCQIINRFADWLSKLRLSDFRITGPSAPDNNRQTNFLAKQDAIMRLLLEDCDRLTNLVKDFILNLNQNDEKLIKTKSELLDKSFVNLNNGLSNVRSLQKLIER